MLNVEAKNANTDSLISANQVSLQKQSRSFAIPIMKLDDRFKTPVMVEYNLNKIIDTIEDAALISTPEKIYLIQEVCDCLQKNQYSKKLEERIIPLIPSSEATVIKNYQATIQLLNTLSQQEIMLAKKWTQTMADGMCEFLTKSIETQSDLNSYCYYVAGTVGHYLSELLALNGNNVDAKSLHSLKTHATGFGLFLQKLNIIRDYHEDSCIKQRSFWPKNYFNDEQSKLNVLNRLCQETLLHDVPHAINYYKNIPAGHESFDLFIRFILSSGLEYIKLLRNNQSVFSKIKVKLPQLFIKGLYDRVAKYSPDSFYQYCQNEYRALSNTC